MTSSAPAAGDKAERPAALVNSLGMKMILVKADRFDAWTPSMNDYIKMLDEGKRPGVAFGQNRPHVPIPVEIEADYYLAEFPVTNAMYRLFAQDTGRAAPGGRLVDFYWRPWQVKSTWNDAGYQGEDLPVVGVDDRDLKDFCQWLSQKEGRTYRAPTIHEFEYAARAGTDTLFWWGDDPDARRMNFGMSMIGHPTPAGSYPPNPWGFHDVHGNVWEMCDDSGRWLSKGSAFNSPGHMTGADVYGSYGEGPHQLKLLSMGFRLACDATEGTPRANDLPAPTILPARPQGPQVPKLDISAGERIDLGPLATNCANFIVTQSGTWILNNKRSTDQGKTWQTCSERLGEEDACRQLRDGTILSVRGPVGFNNVLEGKGHVSVYISRDDWQTIESINAPIQVPMGLKFHSVRGLTELEDGRLLLTLYGNMEGDRVWTASPVAAELIHQYTWFKNRVILVESTDRGRSWRFVSTVSYHPELTPMGQNESDIFLLPDGQLIAAMRTGVHGYEDMHGRHHLDQPLLLAWSNNEGRTWTDAHRVYIDGEMIPGIYPRILRTESGVLTILRTRGEPAGSVIFCPDGRGSIWSDQFILFESGASPDEPYHADMQDMALIGPNTILVVDVVSRTGWPPRHGWHAEGVPITVSKVEAPWGDDS